MSMSNGALGNRRAAGVAWWLALGIFVAGAGVSRAEAFPTSGGSYKANVAFRINPAGAVLGSVAGVIGGPSNPYTAAGSASDIRDCGWARWRGTRMDTVSDSMRVTLTLDQAYELNRIRTVYHASYLPTDYKLRVYDGAGWTTVRDQGLGAPASSDVAITFTKQSVTQIEWTAYGGNAAKSVAMTELMAYVAATAATAPRLDGGYNITPAGISLVSQSNFESGAIPLVDDLWALGDRAIGTQADGPDGVAVFDLGRTHRLNQIRMGFGYTDGSGWTGVRIETSKDQSTWATQVDLNTFQSGTQAYNLSVPTDVRYIRVTDKNLGGGFCTEMSVFAIYVPPVGTAVMIR